MSNRTAAGRFDDPFGCTLGKLPPGPGTPATEQPKHGNDHDEPEKWVDYESQDGRDDDDDDRDQNVRKHD
jgi:hypothetical protein